MPTPADKRAPRWAVGGLAAVGVAGLTVVFALLLRTGFRRAVVVPVIQGYFRLRFYLSLLPQYLIWTVLSGGMAVFLVSRYLQMVHATSRRQGRTAGRPEEPDPLLSLAQKISRARRRPFYRRMIVRELGRTAVRIIAKREGLSLPEAQKRFANGGWCRDRAVWDLFLHARDHKLTIKIDDFDRRLDEAVSVLERLEQGV